MGKRKSCELSGQRTNAVELFIRVWTSLRILHTQKAGFALNWMWTNEDVLAFFASKVLGLRSYSRSLLYNGYTDCKTCFEWVFSESCWQAIDDVFANNKLSDTRLPKPVREYMETCENLQGKQLRPFLEARVEAAGRSTHLSSGKCYVKRISGKTQERIRACFLGDWKTHGKEAIRRDLWFFCRQYPSQFVVVQKQKCMTILIDREPAQPSVIAVIIQQDLLSIPNRIYIRTLMANLFTAHNGIGGRSRMALASHMVGYGPFHHRFKRNGRNKVSFYTHLAVVKDLFRQCSLLEQFGALLDRYAHGTLVDIILSLYLCCCPHLLETFFQFSKPHFGVEDYEATDLERELGGPGPCAYQLYMTADYCCELHADDDVSAFTLCYASHPDAESTTPIDFVMASYGVRLPIGDGDLFAFRSSVAHGTGYRPPSRETAYVGGVVVNAKLQHLMSRRRKQSTTT